MCSLHHYPISRTFSLFHIETLYPLNNNFPFPLHTVLSVSEFDYIPHISGIIQYLSFCDWLTLLSIMSSGFIYVVALSISFLKLNNISLYVYVIFCLYIHHLIDIWVFSTFWLLRIMLLWKWVFFESLPLILLSMYQYVELLIILCLHFWRTSVFYSGYTILHSHQSCSRVLISPYPCQYLFSVLFCFV